jgi:hypothetical protein
MHLIAPLRLCPCIKQLSPPRLDPWHFLRLARRGQVHLSPFRGYMAARLHDGGKPLIHCWRTISQKKMRVVPIIGGDELIFRAPTGDAAIFT